MPTLKIHLSEENVDIDVNVDGCQTIDDLMDVVLAKIGTMNHIALLRGDHKEMYAFYLPASKTWARDFKKLDDYKLLAAGKPQPECQFKLKSKFKKKKGGSGSSSRRSMGLSKMLSSMSHKDALRPKSPGRRGSTNMDLGGDVARRKQLQINVTEYSLNFPLRCAPTTTAQDVLDYVCEQKPEMQEVIEDFAIAANVYDGAAASGEGGSSASGAARSPRGAPAISVTEAGERTTSLALLNNTDQLGPLGLENIASLECRRINHNVKIIVGDEEKHYKFHPDRSVMELVQYVVAQEGLSYASPGFYLRPAKGMGMVLSNDRTLRSYRLSPGDKLEVVQNASQVRIQRRNSTSPAPVAGFCMFKIYCPEFTCSRSLKVPADSTIAEVIYHFAKKVPDIEEVGKYGLFDAKNIVEKTDERGEPVIIATTSGSQYDVNSPLNSHSFDSPIHRLVFKKHGKSKLNDLFVANIVFGVNIEELELVQAEGESALVVPKVLVELQHALMASNGLDAERVFEVKGSPEGMKAIENQFTAFEFPVPGCEYDPYDLAACIRDWFRRLPTPLLSVADDDDIAICTMDDEECLLFPGKLPEPHKSVFLWLLNLMFEVAKNSKVNEMDIVAIAKCFSSSIMYRPDDMVQRKLAENLCNHILTNILEHLLSEWGRGIHGSQGFSTFKSIKNFSASNIMSQMASDDPKYSSISGTDGFHFNLDDICLKYNDDESDDICGFAPLV